MSALTHLTDNLMLMELYFTTSANSTIFKPIASYNKSITYCNKACGRPVRQCTWEHPPYSLNMNFALTNTNNFKLNI